MPFARDDFDDGCCDVAAVLLTWPGSYSNLFNDPCWLMSFGQGYTTGDLYSNRSEYCPQMPTAIRTNHNGGWIIKSITAPGPHLHMFYYLSSMLVMFDP